MYAERRSRLAGAVVWTRESRPPREIRVLPDGCVDLIWDGRGLLVAGPDTRARLVTETAREGYVGLRFAPGIGPQVFGLPAYELRDQQLPLDALWPSQTVRDLEERVAQATERPPLPQPMPHAAPQGGPGHAGPFGGWVAGLLEETALGRLSQTDADPFGRRVAAALARGATVAAVAGALGLSERQLHRRSLAAFGYGPKTLARILRMERALSLARRGTPFADVAATSGYADQAHLSREIKSLAGAPLSALLTA